MVDFDALGISPTEILSENWQQEPDAVELLASAVGRVLRNPSNHALLALARVAHDLEFAGNDDYARFVLQAILLKLSGTPFEEDSEPKLLLSEESYNQSLTAVTNRDRDPDLLLACVLTVAGSIARAERDFSRAASLLGTAAEQWSALGVASEAARAMLAQGAALNYAMRHNEAQEVNSKAEEIFLSLGDKTAIAMLYINEVSNRIGQGDLDAAESSLQFARTLSAPLNDGHLNTSIHLTAGILQIERSMLDLALEEFKKAERSAHRRQDYSQLLVAERNIAKLLTDNGKPKLGMRWWMKARNTARLSHSRRDEQDLEHGIAVHLAELGRYEEAVEAFDRSLAISTTFGDELASARARADRGAVLLSWAVNLREQGTSAEASETTTGAEQQLMEARTQLEDLLDLEWAAITVRNLRSAWLLGDRSDVGTTLLLGSADAFSAEHPEYAAELRRNAGLLALVGSPEVESATALGWIVDAATQSSDVRTEQAWALVSDAALISDSAGLPTEALALYDEALQRLSKEDDPTSWGNIQNDAALAAASSGDFADASRRLRDVLEIAETTNNRVLEALALSNLGETTLEAGEREESREHFERAAILSEKVGDAEGASLAWSSIANSFIVDKRISDARAATNRALHLAEELPQATARAWSARASADFAEGNYLRACNTWIDCSRLVGEEKSGEYLAFALDCYARLDDWPLFRRRLDAWAGKLQRKRATRRLTDQLHLSATTWLEYDNFRAAGTVLAYMVLLTVDHVSRSRAAGLHHSARSSSTYLLEPLKTFALVNVYLTNSDTSSKGRARMRTAYERTISRAAPDDAASIIATIDRVFDRNDKEPRG